MSLHLIVLLSYSGLLMGLGVWLGRRVDSSDGFFVAGRILSPLLLFSTMLAANIGAGSTVGAAGLGYRDGLSAWWWVGSAGFGSIFLAFWIGPRLRKLAKLHNLRTLGDFLEYRYGKSVRIAIGILLWFGTLAILAGQLIAIAWVLNVITGLEHWMGCIVGGVVVTVYFSSGGLLTTVWINLLQLVLLLIGFVVVFPLALIAVDGWTPVFTTTQHIEGYWNVWQGGGSGWFYLAMLGPAFVVSPGLLQKVYGARDDRTVRIGVGLNAVALLVFAVIPPLLGMMARTAFPDLQDYDLALPTLLMDSLPPLVGALGLAALFSAEVSSADAILFMLSTSLSQDLYKGFARPTASDTEVLSVARWAAIVSGVLGTIVAILSESIAGALSFFYTLLTVSLFVPVIGGLYLRRFSSTEALASIAGGIGLTLLVQLNRGEQGLAGFTPAMCGLVGAGLAWFIASRFKTQPVS